MESQIYSNFLIVKPTSNHPEILSEYDDFVANLIENKINFLELPLVEDLESERFLCSKDWISFHGDGEVAVYPLSTLERQKERNDSVFSILEKKGFEINNVVDFTEAEEEGFFLEGMSSVVLDRVNKVAYLCVSSNSDEELFIEFCEELEFTPIVFHVVSDVVMHTSSILNISEKFVMVASGLIKDKKERKLVSTQLKKSGRELIYVSEEQVANNICDIKQLKNDDDESFIVMSKSVYNTLSDDQKCSIAKYGEILTISYDKTESYSGHSVGSSLNEVAD